MAPIMLPDRCLQKLLPSLGHGINADERPRVWGLQIFFNKQQNMHTASCNQYTALLVHCHSVFQVMGLILRAALVQSDLGEVEETELSQAVNLLEPPSMHSRCHNNIKI